MLVNNDCNTLQPLVVQIVQTVALLHFHEKFSEKSSGKRFCLLKCLAYGTRSLLRSIRNKYDSRCSANDTYDFYSAALNVKKQKHGRLTGVTKSCSFAK